MATNNKTVINSEGERIEQANVATSKHGQRLFFMYEQHLRQPGGVETLIIWTERKPQGPELRGGTARTPKKVL